MLADATTWTDVGTVEPFAGELMLTPAKLNAEEMSTVRTRFKTLRKLTSENFGYC